MQSKWFNYYYMYFIIIIIRFDADLFREPINVSLDVPKLWFDLFYLMRILFI